MFCSELNPDQLHLQRLRGSYYVAGLPTPNVLEKINVLNKSCIKEGAHVIKLKATGQGDKRDKATITWGVNGGLRPNAKCVTRFVLRPCSCVLASIRDFDATSLAKVGPCLPSCALGSACKG